MGLVPVHRIDVGFCSSRYGGALTLEYDIIMADNLLQLIKFVRQQIERGWEPLGGPITSKGSEYYVQAIVRKNS